MQLSMTESTQNPYLPLQAEIVERIEESDSIFTWQLKITDPQQRENYSFEPGQFNMLYLYGVGEVPISIVSYDENNQTLAHTIRMTGRVTNAMAKLQPGDFCGLRGPFGRGWPMQQAQNKNVVVITGGLGCAPSVSIIKSILSNRSQYRHLSILQGVKNAQDLIWREQYDRWQQQPDTTVLLAADVASPEWHDHTGLVTSLFDKAGLKPENSTVMMCGPEPMMHAAARALIQRGFAAVDIWLSMERNMQCAVGYCGHCQIGAQFVCRNGPVFTYPEMEPLLAEKGF